MDESATSAVPEPLGDAAASGPESLECPAGPALPCGLSQDQEAFRKLGLTKEVLAAHTQKEEQSFLLRFREIMRERKREKGEEHTGLLGSKTEV